jgi:ribosomal-protein-alanine N-acetyltransferase
MPYSHKQQIRQLQTTDIYRIERLMHTSEYVYQRFTVAELPLLLKRYPASGMCHGTTLYGFLLSQIFDLPCAWIGGFGVSWTESKNYRVILTQLLEHVSGDLMAKGVRYLHYSGNDVENDWLRTILLNFGFIPYRRLYAYDKFNFSIPTEGNQQVLIRPVRVGASHDPYVMQESPNDIPDLLTIEAACFEDLWRNNSITFRDIADTHPYFVVAELDGKVVGYQFNTQDDDAGYLVRIAVHPSVSGQGIGARLMAEAMRFFQRARVSRIMLNTQEDNYHAHRLYERFGFVRLQQTGFVLRKML